MSNTTQSGNTPETMDILGLLDHLPHRYPFVMLDRVTECVPGDYIKAVKNVSVNEPHFTGHFPGSPVMPGVLILEAMAQASGVLTLRTLDKLLDDNEYYYFASIEKARFKRPVVPGDQLLIHSVLTACKRHLWKFDVVGTVDGEVACTAKVSSARVTTDGNS